MNAVMIGLAACVVFFLAPPTNARQRAQMPPEGLASPSRAETHATAPTPPGSGPLSPALAQPDVPANHSDSAEHSDDGRGFELVYVDVQGGAQFVSFDALSSNEVWIAGTQWKTSSLGPSISVGTGLRLHSFTLGPRFRFGTFSDWDLWTLNLDLGWRIPLGKLEAYGIVGGGFAKLPYRGDNAATGFGFRFGGGLDYYASNVVSVGGRIDVDLLRLSHPAVMDASRQTLAQSWSSTGLVVTTSAIAGVHF